MISTERRKWVSEISGGLGVLRSGRLGAFPRHRLFSGTNLCWAVLGLCFRSWLIGSLALTTVTLAEPVTEALREAERLYLDGLDSRASTAWRDALEKWLTLPAGDRSELLAEAELALHWIDTLSRSNGDAPESLPLLEKLSRVEATGSPKEAAALRLFAAHARHLWGWARLEAGKSLDEAREAWQPLGLLKSWRVIGPFDNERGSQLLTELPPEKEIRLDAQYDGKKRPVRWRELPAVPVAGLVDFAALLEPSEQCLAYALTFLHSDSDRDAALRLSTCEGYRVWVNGQLAGSSDVHRQLGWDQDSLGVKFQKGWNTLLVKVSQTTGDWLLTARLTGPDGSALEGVREDPPPRDTVAPRLEGDTPSVAVEDGLVPILRSALELHPGDARAHFVLGALLHERGAHDETEHPDTELLTRAVQLSAKAPLYHHLLGKTHQREAVIAAQKDDNAWRFATEQSASLGCARAARDLAEYYIETFDNLSRAHGYLEQALLKSPDYPDAIVLLGKLEARVGVPRALERAHERVWKLPHRPTSAMHRRAWELKETGKLDEAEKLYVELASRNRTSDADQTNPELSKLLLARGQSERGLAVLKEWGELEPFNTEPLQILAKSLEGLDRIEEAAHSLDRALQIAPEDHRLHSEKGKLLLRADRRAEALVAFHSAMDLQPNLPDVRDYMDFLRAAKNSFEDDFRRDVAALVQGAFDRKDTTGGGDPARGLLQLTAIQVNQDGTTKTFSQTVVQVLNERGIRMYDRYRTHYAVGEQVLEFKKAKVTHPDGSSAEAKLSRHGSSDGGTNSDTRGNYSGASVDLPPLSALDVVEVEFVREDIAQSFFGDYFGHREIFQEQVPLQEKILILRVPAERKFYFHQRNMKLEPTVTRDEASGMVTYLWTRKDVPKLDPEPAMPDPSEASPVLEVSTFESWDTFNTWYWNLIKKQFETSPEIAKKVRELTSGTDSDLAKVRAIYNFVVTDVRYNAWEFGVHGFKPYNAAAIFARRFGDCKDKALLLCVMLKEVGLTARPVLIYADERRGKEDLQLPMVNHFNHCIAYMPPEKGREELFLDGTAQFHSYKDLPSMDRGATVLVVGNSEEKGSIQQVPWNKPEELSITEEAVVEIHPDLSADLQVRARAAGDYAVHVRSQYEIESERRTRLERMYGKRFAASSVKEESFSNLLNLDEPVSFSVRLSIPRFVVEAPEGLAIRAAEDFFGTAQSLSGIGALEKREYDVLLGNPRASNLRTVYHLPEGFKVKSLPSSQHLKNRFGRLEVTFKLEGSQKLVVERLIEVTSHRVTLAEYSEFREFSASISRLEDEKIVLERA